MNNYNLGEKSKSYYSEAEIYDIFSRREDAPAKIFKAILPIIQGKTVLDLGCGTGKYAALFAEHTKKIFALDASAKEIDIARKRIYFKNIDFIVADARKIPLKDKSVDIIFSAWVLGTIADDSHKAMVVEEMERVLKPGGEIYLIENDTGGEFERIRGRTKDPLKRTATYNKWLQKEMEFRVFKRFITYFRFTSGREAKQVIKSIWGESAVKQIKTNNIKHKIIIFTK